MKEHYAIFLLITFIAGITIGLLGGMAINQTCEKEKVHDSKGN